MYSFGKSRLKKGGEKIGNFFSAKYTIRFELEIYKVGFPVKTKNFAKPFLPSSSYGVQVEFFDKNVSKIS